MDSYLNRARAARAQRKQDRLDEERGTEPEDTSYSQGRRSGSTLTLIPDQPPVAPANAPGGQNNDLLTAITTLMKSQTQEIIQGVQQAIKESGGMAP
jgi:hypothetical protein